MWQNPPIFAFDHPNLKNMKLQNQTMHVKLESLHDLRLKT